MSRNDLLLTRLRDIGSATDELERRIGQAERAVRDERSRFAGGDAGRIQWNWYVGQLIADIGFERYRLASAIRKKPKPGEVPPGPILQLLEGLVPRLLGLQEAPGTPKDLSEIA